MWTKNFNEISGLWKKDELKKKSHNIVRQAWQKSFNNLWKTIKIKRFLKVWIVNKKKMD